MFNSCPLSLGERVRVRGGLFDSMRPSNSFQESASFRETWARSLHLQNFRAQLAKMLPGQTGIK